MFIQCGKQKFDVQICRTLSSQFIGMMFKHLKKDGLLFIFKKEKNVSLHMLFVFYKLDIVYINKNMEVIKILKKIKPFIPYVKPIKCKYLLELKECKNVKIGNKLIFI